MSEYEFNLNTNQIRLYERRTIGKCKGVVAKAIYGGHLKTKKLNGRGTRRKGARLI